MKSFNQFIKEANDKVLTPAEIRGLRKNIEDTLRAYKAQTPTLIKGTIAGLDKCISILNDAPFEKIRKIGVAWWADRNDSHIREMYNILNGISKTTMQIKGIHGSMPDSYTLPATKLNLIQMMDKMHFSDPKYVKWHNSLPPTNPYAGMGNFVMDWVSPEDGNLLTEASRKIKGPPPSVPARKGAYFLGGGEIRGSGAYLYDVDDYNKMVDNCIDERDNIKAAFEHQKSCAKVMNHLGIIASIEKNYNSGNFSEAVDYCWQLSEAAYYFNNNKKFVELFSTRYQELFSKITTLRKQ